MMNTVIKLDRAQLFRFPYTLSIINLAPQELQLVDQEITLIKMTEVELLMIMLNQREAKPNQKQTSSFILKILAVKQIHSHKEHHLQILQDQLQVHQVHQLLQLRLVLLMFLPNQKKFHQQKHSLRLILQRKYQQFSRMILNC